MAKDNRVSFITRTLYILMVLLTFGNIADSYSQNASTPRKLEYSAGFGMIIYQSGYGMNNSFGMEAFTGKHIIEPIKWQAGLRLGFNPILPEAFFRLLVTEEFGCWIPSIGLENGFSKRASFNSNSNLLRETREAMDKEIGWLYISSHVEFLAFRLNNSLEVSILEIDFGTHYRNFGNTLRLQTNWIRLNMTF